MTNKVNHSFKIAATGLLGASLLIFTATGCESGQQDDMAAQRRTAAEIEQDVATNVTPELAGTTDRPADVWVKISRRWNTDLRGLTDDMINSMYWDHPSSLNRHPVP